MAVSALNQTLQSLTFSKIRELEKKQSAYERRKAELYTTADQQPMLIERVSTLLAGTKAIHPDASKDHAVTNIGRWLRQHNYDSAVTEDMLRGFERALRDRLDAYSRKLSLADLYSRLLTEWTTKTPADGSRDGGVTEDDYAVVDDAQKQRLQQLCDQFEAVVFAPRETSAEAIGAFLDGLFPDDESMERLEDLREKVTTATTKFLETAEPFTLDSLTATIRALMAEDILSEEKQEVLKGFLQNEVALTEIVDVLNLRWADLDNWDWYTDGEGGIPVLPRQQLNGKYRIWMDEDVLQLIFVQYIGIRLCNLLKDILTDFIKRDGVWNWAVGPQITNYDWERRNYYFRAYRMTEGVETDRRESYLDTYFLLQLPRDLDTLAREGDPYEDDGSDDDSSSAVSDESYNRRRKNPARKNVKQELLRTIAAETLIHRNIYGKAAVVQSDLHWFGTGLPHSTIFAIMRYVGFNERWVAFFQKYLEAPLNMDQSSEGRKPTGPRTRKCGVPMAHASEKLIGELVLFFMDLAVNRETGLLLYRLHDDLWLCGEPSKCAQAWDVMGEFAKVTGLTFNMNKTGSVYLAESTDPVIAGQLPKGPVTFGILELDANSGKWLIDQKQVDAHARQLKKQLEGCDSVISWIRTWNSCIGRFFQNTFGQPAFCFGQPHVDSILVTYKRLQEGLFEGSTVTQHLRHMIRARFGVVDVPDAFFYYPEELGGLGLRNPFISPFLVRDSLEDTPLRAIEKFQKYELSTYQTLKKEFEAKTQVRQQDRLRRKITPPVSEEELDTFMSFEEYTRFRWQINQQFRGMYSTLLDVPEPQNIEMTEEVRNKLKEILTPGDFERLDPEKMWILQMYGSEVTQKYGGLNLVDRRYLPVGVMAMVKEQKVRWQMVL